MRPAGPIHRSPRTAALAPLVLLAVLAPAAALSGCTGKSADHPSHRAAATPSQPLAAAPDPKSITVPTAATPSATDSAAPAPKGPTTSLTARQIWDRAAAVMSVQSSVAVTIDTVTDDHVRLHATSKVASDGDCVGQFTGGGGHAQVIHVGQTGYVKGDRAIWEKQDFVGADIASDVDGYWVSGPMVQLGYFGIDAMCNLGLATQDVQADFGGTMSKGAPLTFEGRRVVPVKQTSDSGSVTLYVSATGPATVLKSVRTGGTPLTVVFTGFGVPVRAKAPAGARLLP